ncbi:hypothetical protein FC093_05970 [Ilyomonas limi]|uniref:WGxxGxxG-CTERM domain-containing protein n=1 Tax=Ilyomonas limi TaxID=2575867 RepID=A0A4U3L5R7_9BACT|nr:hypothetical protein [Ilyomonas limi]TKK70292.1 hypothetical protein FC093_05970 [Ilyomonas limi]
MKLKHCITALLLIAAINFTPTRVNAQVEFGDEGGDPDTNVPFDGGIGILVAAGVAYGIKKKYEHNKEQQAEK